MFFLLKLLLDNVLDAKRLEEAKKNKDKKADYIVEEVTKFCPPHKWRYQEVKDQDGNTVKWKLICDVCGPLKPSAGPARME